MSTPLRQHLIDPEICIRCNTCEETCPIDAVTHNEDNYVVDASICNACLDCIAPCPTGAIDNWRIVREAYSLEEQFSWDELPEEEEGISLDEGGEGAGDEAKEDEVTQMLAEAHAGAGGQSHAPASASQAYVNLYTRAAPAKAKVAGNFRLTDKESESDIRHIVLDFGTQSFPVLEGQSIGIIPPGTDARGKPHHVRLYSVASPRDGERPNHNNLSLTVKREVTLADGERYEGVASSYLCDLEKGADVEVTGPFGNSFLMPNDPAATLIMVCTGTGSAPFRAMTERRRRRSETQGTLLLYFGARTPGELPYFGPLMKLPERLIQKELCFSRLADKPKEYVQDRMRKQGAEIAGLLKSDKTHLYVCGLKGMETGVTEALKDLCREAGMDWSSLSAEMRETGRFHVETY
ncbi:MAG: benzoyl-CoA 2,3-epoxidase subunit BoxA [Pseudomonadota bacterium]